MRLDFVGPAKACNSANSMKLRTVRFKDTEEDNIYEQQYCDLDFPVDGEHLKTVQSDPCFIASWLVETCSVHFPFQWRCQIDLGDAAPKTHSGYEPRRPRVCRPILQHPCADGVSQTLRNLGRNNQR